MQELLMSNWAYLSGYKEQKKVRRRNVQWQLTKIVMYEIPNTLGKSSRRRGLEHYQYRQGNTSRNKVKRRSLILEPFKRIIEADKKQVTEKETFAQK